MSLIDVDNLTKSFASDAGPVQVLDRITFSVEKGRFLTIFGPNGCGKTTLANILIGVESYDSGSIRMEEGAKDGMALVPQDYRATLLPWASVRSNILFPLRIQGVGKQARARRLDALLKQLNVSVNLRGRVYNLSGGQAQLVCLLRALITDPQLLILDEPFSALDYQTSIALRQRLLDIWEKMKLTVLLISHDLDEALYLGDETMFLSSQPASVAETLPIALKRPRPIDILGTAAFAELKAQALRIFTHCLEGQQTSVGSQRNDV